MNPSQSANGVNVSTHCRAVSTRGITASVPGVWELWMYERTINPGLGLYPPWVAPASRTLANQQLTSGVSVSTL